MVGRKPQCEVRAPRKERSPIHSPGGAASNTAIASSRGAYFARWHGVAFPGHQAAPGDHRDREDQLLHGGRVDSSDGGLEPLAFPVRDR